MVRKISTGYRVQIRVGGVRKGHVWTKKADAEKEERELTREKEFTRAGIERPKDNILFLDHCAHWFRKRVRERPDSTTAGEDQKLRGNILPAIGNRPIGFITTGDILELLDELQERKGYTNATRNRYRALLHKIFKDAFIEGKIIVNPVSRVPLLKETPKRKTPLDLEERNKLIGAARARSQEDEFFILVCLYTGGRVSQIAALQNQDFDLEHSTVTFARMWEQATREIRDGIKGNPEGITIPMFPIVAEAFRRHIARTKFKRPTDFVFVNERGACRGGFTLKGKLANLCEAAGIRRVSPHVLRATFATMAEEAGYSKEDIQKMLGHSTVIVTQKYTRRQVGPLIEKGERIGFGEIDAKNVVKMRKKGV